MSFFVAFILLILTNTLVVAAQSDCPSFTIVGPSSMIFPEQVVEFRVKFLTHEYPKNLTYVWGSSAGEFVSGFKPTAKFQTSYEEGGRNITVFAKIDGLPPNCPNITSDIFPTASIPEEEPLDRLENATRYDVIAGIDNLYVAVSSNPGYNGLIEIHFGTNESRVKRLERLRDLSKAIQFRKRDLSRFEILVIERPTSDPHMVLWIAPPNVVPRYHRNERFEVYKAANFLNNLQKVVDSTLCRCK
jgi:hypothetical protein